MRLVTTAGLLAIVVLITIATRSVAPAVFSATVASIAAVEGANDQLGHFAYAAQDTWRSWRAAGEVMSRIADGD